MERKDGPLEIDMGPGNMVTKVDTGVELKGTQKEAELIVRGLRLLRTELGGKIMDASDAGESVTKLTNDREQTISLLNDLTQE